jgi:hypothetical protein
MAPDSGPCGSGGRPGPAPAPRPSAPQQPRRGRRRGGPLPPLLLPLVALLLAAPGRGPHLPGLLSGGLFGGLPWQPLLLLPGASAQDLPPLALRNPFAPDPNSAPPGASAAAVLERTPAFAACGPPPTPLVDVHGLSFYTDRRCAGAPRGGRKEGFFNVVTRGRGGGGGGGAR